MIGEVFGNYRITATLGEGGMGTVYLAEHPSIGRKVAVKMIRPAFSNDAETLRRFVREARSTATLRHPALVDVMDYGVHEKTGSAYIIMEYLEGESLDARLEREGVLSPRRAVDIARQIALGMAAAHRAGIIHRDLKPGNVHLIADPDRPGVDVVKVLDFGIAKLANHDTGAGPTTRSDVLLGTPRYMAPEQCRGGGAFDQRVDIYSLGCLLYETLSGRPPFTHEWPGELIAAHLGETPVSLRALVPTLPEALESIVMRAIAKHPDHRQPTMGHFARELEPFLGIDVSVPPVAAGPSVLPAVPPPGGAPDAATTTASVVMRYRAAIPAGAAPAQPSFSPVQQLAPRPTDEPSRKRLVSSPVFLGSLIGAAALAGATALVAAIAGRGPATSTAMSAPSAVLVVAPPPVDTGAPSGTDTPGEDRSDDSTASTASAPVSARAPLPTPPMAATATEAIISAIRVKVANPRPGLRVMVDGRPMSLPLRLPRDQKTHALTFTVPNFKLETKTIVADQDQTLTLEYRPKLYVP